MKIIAISASHSMSVEGRKLIPVEAPITFFAPVSVAFTETSAVACVIEPLM